MAKKKSKKTPSDCINPAKLQIAMREALPDCTDEEILSALEKVRVYVRDEIDEVKERVTLAEVTPHIGKCFLDFEHNRDTNKITARSYYKLLGASGYNALYLYFRVDDEGEVRIEPAHRSGFYVVENYTPISTTKFNSAFDKMLSDLQHIEETL